MAGIESMLNEVLTEVQRLLEYQTLLGVEEIPIVTASTAPAASAPKPQTSPASPSPIIAPTPILADPLKAVEAMQHLRTELHDCKRCKLHQGRTNVVFGVGNPCAQLMFIGEGPGRDEDLQAEPFVGAAGQLLTKIIEAMGLKRDEVYIANIVKCRPPNNRVPEPDEAATCMPFLIRQVQIVNPKAIVCLGSTAIQNLLTTDRKISSMRGKFQQWQGIPVMPTFHPAFLLRNPAMKKPVWEDMQKVMELLGIKPASTT